MIHFSEKVSHAMKEVGVKKNTGYWWMELKRGSIVLVDNELKELNEMSNSKDVVLGPAYALSDLISLMPEVCKKIEVPAVVCSKCGTQWQAPSHCCDENPGEPIPSWMFLVAHLVSAFQSGISDNTAMEKAEEYLMTVLRPKIND